MPGSNTHSVKPDHDAGSVGKLLKLLVVSDYPAKSNHHFRIESVIHYRVHKPVTKILKTMSYMGCPNYNHANLPTIHR